MRRLLIAGVPLTVLLLLSVVIRAERTASQAPDPEAIARAHLQQNRDRYGLRPDLSDLDLVYTKESQGAYHVRFQQTLGGRPVFGSFTTVNISKGSDRASLVLNRYVPRVPPVVTRAMVSEEQAIAIAEAAVGVKELRGVVSTSQVYFPVEKSLYLAWQVMLPAVDPLGDWLVVVRADDGHVLLKQNVMPLDSGQVFDPNPVVTSGGAIPPPWDCDSGANATLLASEYRTRTLMGIQGGQDKLKGDYVDLTAPGIVGDYKSAGQADEASRNYVYACDDDRFEEVMVYYHVDMAQRKIQSLGFTGSSGILEGPIPAHAHYMSDCNAFYSPFDAAIHFGDSDDIGCAVNVDTAEDPDIIVHEYGHAIQDNQVPGWGAGDPLAVEEALAMGEGFGDFVAAAIYGDPCEGEWSNFGQSQCGGQPGLRWLQNAKVYPTDFDACRPAPPQPAEEHCAGEIWGGALWDLVEALGDDEAARDLVLTLVLDSHFYLDPLSSFAEGASAIRQADIDLYGGTHVSTIDSVFAGRGIVSTGPISDFPYAYLRIRHTYVGDLVVRLKAGDLGSPDCDLLLWNQGGGGADDLVGYVDLTGSPCEPFLPPSVGTPWWLEVQDLSPGEVGNVADFQVALSDTRRCLATDVPVPIPDKDGPAYSMVDCTTTSEPLPTPTATPTPTPTPTPGPCILPFTDLGIGTDTDCDGATDANELGSDPTKCGTRDPNDRWDFYDVPVPTIHSGGDMNNRDSAVTLFNDVLAVLEYSGTIANGPPNGAGRDYDDDFDGDGIDDGVAYDREVGAPWPELGPTKSHTAAPGNAVTLFVDVLLVLDQSGHICP